MTEVEDITILSSIIKGQRPPLGFYRKSRNRRAVMKFVIEQVLHRQEKERFTPLSINDFKRFNLYGLLTTYYRGSPRRAIEETYQEELKSYDIFKDPSLILADFFGPECKEPPRNFWNQEKNRILTTRWFVEKVLFRTADTIYDITTQNFNDAGLGGFLSHYYSCSITKALIHAYPEAKIYCFSRIDKAIWNDINIRKAALIDILNHHRISPEEALGLSMNQLIKMGLKHSLSRYYHGNIRELMKDLWPHLLHRNH